MAAKSFMSLMKMPTLRTCEGEELDAARTAEMFLKTCFWGLVERIGYSGSVTYSLLLDTAGDDLHGLGVEGDGAGSVDELKCQ